MKYNDIYAFSNFEFLVTDFAQHNKVGMTFYESDDLGVFRVLDQITFAVTRYGSVCDFR